MARHPSAAMTTRIVTQERMLSTVRIMLRFSAPDERFWFLRWHSCGCNNHPRRHAGAHNAAVRLQHVGRLLHEVQP